jgi:hypothetical protein
MEMHIRPLKKSAPSNDQLEAITKMIMKLFEHWKLTYEQQAMLLSLSPNTHSTIARYKRGVAKISPARDTQDRVSHLLSIHKHLRRIFPLNKELVYEWPTTPNKAFQGRSPIQVIADEGFVGLVQIKQYLENYLAS